MVSFGVLVFVIGVSGSLITANTLVGYNKFNIFFKLFVALLVLLGWLAPLWLNGLQKIPSLSPALYGFIERSGYFLFGTMFILFSLLLLRDICWALAYGLSQYLHFHVVDPRDAQALLKANIVVVPLALAFAFYSLYEGVRIPRFNEVELSSPKITQETTVLLATDLHIDRGMPVARVRKLVEEINARQPDVIALGGDIIDDDPIYLEKQMQELSRLKAKHGVYAALGNHEAYRKEARTSAALSKAGFKVLIGTGEKVGGTDVFMLGINDYGTMRRLDREVSIENILKRTAPEDYKILISHTPFFIDTLKDNEIDLQLSGHTHGGQIFPFHLLVAEANHYLAGLYDVDKMKLFVSRGAGVWGPPMRLLAPSDITLIRLTPQP